MQKREPFNPWSLLKSPVGIMVIVMVVGVFLMPMLMDNMGKFKMYFHLHAPGPQCQPVLPSHLLCTRPISLSLLPKPRLSRWRLVFPFSLLAPSCAVGVGVQTLRS